MLTESNCFNKYSIHRNTNAKRNLGFHVANHTNCLLSSVSQIRILPGTPSSSTEQSIINSDGKAD